MALNSNATLVIGSGNFFTAPVGTAKPADLGAPDVAWSNIGHTSLEDILSFDSEGGDATVLGTLQAPSLRTTYSKRTESLNLNLQQFDESGLKLYYGSNAVVENGMVQVPTNPETTIVAFLAVFVDKANKFGIYIPKAEIYRGDNIEFSDTESMASLPLKITPLLLEGNSFTYAVTALTSA